MIYINIYTTLQSYRNNSKYAVIGAFFLALCVGQRPPSDRIPSAARSDSVRRPIRFRPPPNRIPSAAQSDSVRRPIRFRPPSDENISRSMGKNVAEVSGLRSTKSNTNSVKLSLKQLRVSFCQTRHSAVCQQKACATPFGTPFVYQ